MKPVDNPMHDLTPEQIGRVHDAASWDDRKTLADVYQHAGSRVIDLAGAYDGLIAVAQYGAAQVLRELADDEYAAKLARAAAARPRDVWSDDPDRTTRRGDTSQLVAREAEQLTRDELDELDPISPARPCLCCGAIR